MKAAAQPAAPDRNALAALAVLTFIWGYNWVVMKVALAYSGPFVFAALRTSLGGLCLLLLLLLARKPFWPTRPWRALLLGLFQTTFFIGLVCWALVSGNAGKSAVLAYTMPFWVILLAPFFLGERLKGLQWLAVLLALGGLLLIFSPWHHTPDLFSSVLALGAGVAWGISVIVAKQTPVDGGWDLLSLTGWQMLMGSAPLILIALCVPAPATHWTPAFMWALFYNVVPANAIAWALWLFAVGRLSATLSGLASLASPIVGVLAGWLQLGEVPSPAETLGMLLVFGALGLLSIGARPRR
ncbi:MAG: DMT family transporter [Burkholderiales bacterium]